MGASVGMVQAPLSHSFPLLVSFASLASQPVSPPGKFQNNPSPNHLLWRSNEIGNVK